MASVSCDNLRTPLDFSEVSVWFLAPAAQGAGTQHAPQRRLAGSGKRCCFLSALAVALWARVCDTPVFVRTLRLPGPSLESQLLYLCVRQLMLPAFHSVLSRVGGRAALRPALSCWKRAFTGYCGSFERVEESAFQKPRILPLLVDVGSFLWSAVTDTAPGSVACILGGGH